MPWASLQNSTATVAPPNGLEGPAQIAASGVIALLVRYLELGAERPPGALTPEEACQGVRQVSPRTIWDEKRAELTAFCDQVLYGDVQRDSLRREILAEARALFEALGKVKPIRRTRHGLTRRHRMRPRDRVVEDLTSDRLDSFPGL